MSHPERIVPDETEPGIVALHRKRYEFAQSRCAGREVLDLACGVGYGSAELATTAAHVVGVDIDAGSIEYARARYGRPNVSFEVMPAETLVFPDSSFDVVCAFEAIEHFADREQALSEIARVLRDDGTLVVSTPQVEQTVGSPANPFHRIEFSRPDFEALLQRYFAEVDLYGQRRLQTRRHRLAQRLDVLGLRRRLPFLRRAWRLLGTRPTAELTSDDVLVSRERIEQAQELVAVCTRPRR